MSVLKLDIKPSVIGCNVLRYGSTTIALFDKVNNRYCVYEGKGDWGKWVEYTQIRQAIKQVCETCNERINNYNKLTHNVK